ncbi:hypothetical protein QR680_008233 [Steinernema hermaphroditum]|uniref:Uncharacterized protein n=1 Tax=Steinernema hermaphroditum TaxID=289476 RepID=A0AA39IFW1_9BILA|nr:hypothetical protein QR680_008233 [Steinernema hermaphroditum]
MGLVFGTQPLEVDILQILHYRVYVYDGTKTSKNVRHPEASLRLVHVLFQLEQRKCARFGQQDPGCDQARDPSSATQDRHHATDAVADKMRSKGTPAAIGEKHLLYSVVRLFGVAASVTDLVDGVGTEPEMPVSGQAEHFNDSPPSSPIYKAPFIVGTASSSSSCYQLHANVQSLLQTVKVNYPMYHSLVMAVVAAPGGTTNLCQKLIAAFDARIGLIEEAMDNLWRLSKRSKNDPIQSELIAEKFYHLYDEVDSCRQKRWDLSYLTYSLNEKGNALYLPHNRISQIKLIQKVFACRSL